MTTPQLPYIKADLPAPFAGDGTEDFKLWCRRFEVAVKANSQTHPAHVHLSSLLPARLSGAAFTLWDGLSDNVKADYDQVKAALSSVFTQHQSIHQFQRCINARPRMPNEPLEVFAAEITRLCLEAFPEYGKKAKDGEKFRRFVAGLSPYLQLKIHEQGMTTLDAALRIAVQFERAHDASRIALSLTNPATLTPTITSPAIPNSLGAPSPSVNSVDNSLLALLQKLDLKLDNLPSHDHPRPTNPH